LLKRRITSSKNGRFRLTFRDIVWGYLQTVFNRWFAENLKSLGIFSDALEDFRERLWHAESLKELKDQLFELINLYIHCPSSIKKQFKELITQTDLFFSLSGIFVKDELKSKLQPYRIYVVVVDENGRRLPAKLTVVHDGVPIWSGYVEKGQVRISLLKGNYEIVAVSRGSSWYAMEIASMSVPAPLNMVCIKLQKHPKIVEAEEKKLPIRKEHYTIQLPSPTMNLLAYFDVHEKWMQMSLQYQLKILGFFAGRKILDVAHTFTGPSMTRFWKETLYDPVLRKLWGKETDVFALTEDQVLIGFELKSRRGLEKNDYGFIDAQQYLDVGADEVYLVHREISREFHKFILKKLGSFDKSIGYATYSPSKLTILRWAKKNPLIKNPEVNRRNKFLKRHFSKLGGRII